MAEKHLKTTPEVHRGRWLRRSLRHPAGTCRRRTGSPTRTCQRREQMSRHETTRTAGCLKPRTRARAKAKITVQSSEVRSYDQTVSPALMEVRLSETFTGDIEDDSPVRALQVLRGDHSASLISMQRFCGKLARARARSCSKVPRSWRMPRLRAHGAPRATRSSKTAALGSQALRCARLYQQIRRAKNYALDILPAAKARPPMFSPRTCSESVWALLLTTDARAAAAEPLKELVDRI